MRPGGSARGPHRSKRLATRHQLPGDDIDSVQVRYGRVDAESVIQHHAGAADRKWLSPGDAPAGGGRHQRAKRRRDVSPLMQVGKGARMEDAPLTVGRGGGPAGRYAECPCPERRSADTVRQRPHERALMRGGRRIQQVSEVVSDREFDSCEGPGRDLKLMRLREPPRAHLQLAWTGLGIGGQTHQGAPCIVRAGKRKVPAIHAQANVGPTRGQFGENRGALRGRRLIQGQVQIGRESGAGLARRHGAVGKESRLPRQVAAVGKDDLPGPGPRCVGGPLLQRHALGA